jgi:tetratricopeptide (TPR) repeat protein
MIVKNEAPVIRRCLDSVWPFITHWVVCDTGSTDGTQGIVREHLRELPGEVLECPWVDFATNRNQAHEAARKTGADYVLMIDADESLVPSQGFSLPRLDCDSHALLCRLDDVDAQWVRRSLMKASVPWRWEGAIHEYTICETAGPTGVIDGLTVQSRSDGARSRLGPKKFLHDIGVLERETRREPTNPRHWFYLAQTHWGAALAGLDGHIEKAIRCYEKRLALGGFDEELYHSKFTIAALREMRGDHWHDVARAYLDAFSVRPTRAEPLWALAVLHSDRGEHAIAEVYARKAARMPRPSDALLVNDAIYRWQAVDELAAALGALGRNDEAVKLLSDLLEKNLAPPREVERIRHNVAFLSGAST